MRSSPARCFFVLGAALVLLSLMRPSAALHAQVVDYVVGPQDVLAISVFNQESLRGNYVVEADGTFTFPLIGRVSVGGLTLREVEERLRSMLADGFFRDPQVSVAIAEYRSQQVFVVGEVRSPGPYPLTGDMSLIEALALAGSVNPAAGGEALIVRPRQGGSADGPLLPDEDDASDVIRVDIRELQSGRLSQNVRLRGGDTIYVPRAELIYITGEVRNPGSYPIQRGMTVLQALSLAGGVTDRGASNRIDVVREVEGEQVTTRVSLQDQVQAGDTLMVPERFF